MPGGSGSLPRQHRRPDDGGRSGGEAAAAVRAGAGGPGGRSRHADPAADRQAAGAARHGLDHRLDEWGDSHLGGEGGLATLLARPAESGRDRFPRLSWRKAGGLPQPAAGRGARPQAPSLAGSDGEEFDQDRQGRGPAQEEAADGGGDRAEGGQGPGPLQGGQAFRLSDHRGKFQLDSPPGGHRAGSEAGRDLRAAHQRTRRAPLGPRHRAQL